MNQKKYGGEDFGKTLEQLKAMAPHAVTLEGVLFEGAAHKVGAILGLAAVGGDLIAEIERLQADAERFAFFAHVAVNDELHDKLEPHMPADAGQPGNIEDVRAHMDLCIQAAKDAGLWPIKPELVLTEDAQADRDAFNNNYGDGNCSCHNNAPCSSCTHPGNPTNQEEDSACWTVAP